MTDLTTTRVLQLSDASGRDIGTFAVDEVEGNLLLGQFTPGADYPAVEPIFRHYSDVVEQQSFSYLDAAEAAVAGLGITVRSPNGESLPVHDVQIYNDGGASFRLPTGPDRNGTHTPG